MCKVKNDLVSSYISEIFTRKGTRYNLRNSDFEIPRFNTICYGKHTLRYQGPYIWSKLGNGMRELPSHSIFKTKIRRSILQVQVFLCYLNIVNIYKYFKILMHRLSAILLLIMILYIIFFINFVIVGVPNYNCSSMS